MAHRIEEMDKTQGIEKHWHGLNEVVEKIGPDNIVLSKWDVTPVPLTAAGKETDYSILQCSDNGALIGKPFDPETYTPISNERFLKLVFEILAGTDHKIVSAGSLCNRNRVFVSVKLKELSEFTVAGRKFLPFLNLGNAFGFLSTLWYNTSITCTVCNNTYTANFADKTTQKFRHTKNVESKLEKIPKLLDAAIGVRAEFAEAFNSFAKVKVGVVRAERIFTGFLTSESDVERAQRSEDAVSTRGVNTIGRLTELFARGAGNKGENLADVFSAATDYYSHESSGGENRLKQFESSEFGSAARKKTEFFELLQDEEKLDSTEKRGAKVMGLPVFN